MKTATLSLLAVVAANAAFPLSENACQCLGDCEESFLGAFDSKCDVNPQYCDGSSQDTCSGGWLTGAFDSVVDAIDDLFTAGKATAEKIEGWATENIQDIPINDVVSKFEDWSASITAKLSVDQWASIELDFDVIVGTWTPDQWASVPAQKLEEFTDRLNELASEQFSAISSEWVVKHFDSIDLSHFSDFTAEQLKDLARETIDKLTEDQWAELNLTALAKWGEKQLRAIHISTCKRFSVEQLQQLDVETITQFSVDQLAAIPWERIGTFAQEQWDAVPVDKLAGLLWEQLQQVKFNRWAKITKREWQDFPIEKVWKLTGEQIASIDGDVLAASAQAYWDKVPIFQLTEMTVEQINRFGVFNLDAEHIASVTQEQWSAVPVEDVVQLSVEQLQSIDFDGLATWTNEQWDAVPVAKLIKMTGRKIRKIPASRVEEFTAEQWASIDIKQMIMFKGEQLNNRAVLAKLSIDALVEFALTGELDLTLLEAEVKVQVEAAIETELEARKAKVTAVLDLIENHGAAEKTKKEKKDKKERAEANPRASAAERKQARSEYQAAQSAEQEYYDQMVEEGVAEPRAADENAAPALASSSALFVAGVMAFALTV